MGYPEQRNPNGGGLVLFYIPFAMKDNLFERNVVMGDPTWQNILGGGAFLGGKGGIGSSENDHFIANSVTGHGGGLGLSFVFVFFLF